MSGQRKLAKRERRRKRQFKERKKYRAEIAPAVAMLEHWLGVPEYADSRLAASTKQLVRELKKT